LSWCAHCYQKIYITLKGLKEKEAGRRKRRRRYEYGRKAQRDSLKMRKGPQSRNIRRKGKSKETDFPLKPPGGNTILPML
jgi:hypothetical protein